MKIRFALSLGLVLVICVSVFTGCGKQSSSISPVPTAAPSPTASPTDEPSPTPRPTATATPTPTPTPTAVPTPTPTPTPNPDTDAEVWYKGGCGQDTWTLYKDGLLVIEGTGDTGDYIAAWDWTGSEGPDLTTQPYWKLALSNEIDIRSGVNIPIKRVIIKEGVTSIGDALFFALPNLTSVEIASSVKRIGSQAFACCSGLTELKLPENISEIGKGAFLQSAIEELVIPESVSVLYNVAADIMGTVYYEGSWSQWVALTGSEPPENVVVAVDDKPVATPAPISQEEALEIVKGVYPNSRLGFIEQEMWYSKSQDRYYYCYNIRGPLGTNPNASLGFIFVDRLTGEYIEGDYSNVP